MSNILRDAAESTMHVAESTLQSVAGFVEDAHRNIELPHIELPTRRRTSPVRPVVLALLGAVALAGVAAMLLRRFEGAASERRPDPATASPEDDAPKSDAPKSDASKSDSKNDVSKNDVTKNDASKNDASKSEAGPVEGNGRNAKDAERKAQRAS